MPSQDLTWSDWLNFDQENISNVPEAPGVFRMHAAMKILYIGDAVNLKEALKSALQNPCTKEASRFCYIEMPSPEALKEEILKGYLEKHDGKLPRCMDEET